MFSLLNKKEKLILTAGGLIASLALITALFFGFVGIDKVVYWFNNNDCAVLHLSPTQDLDTCNLYRNHK